MTTSPIRQSNKNFDQFVIKAIKMRSCVKHNKLLLETILQENQIG